MTKPLPKDRHIHRTGETEERRGDEIVRDSTYFDLDSTYTAGVVKSPDGDVTKTTGHNVSLYGNRSTNVDNPAKDITYGDGSYRNLNLDRDTTETKGQGGTVNNTADTRFYLSTGAYAHDPNGTGDSHDASIEVYNHGTYKGAPGSYRWTGEHNVNLWTSDSTNSRVGDVYTNAGRSYNLSTGSQYHAYSDTFKGGYSYGGGTDDTSNMSFSDYKSVGGNSGWTDTYRNGGVRIEDSTSAWRDKDGDDSSHGSSKTHSVIVHAGGSKSVSNGEGTLSSGHYYELQVSESKGKTTFTGGKDGVSQYSNNNVVVTFQDWASDYNNDGSSKYGGRTVELRLNTYTDYTSAGKVNNTTYSATLTARWETHDRTVAGVPTDTNNSVTIEITPKTLGTLIPMSFVNEIGAVGGELKEFGGKAAVKEIGLDLKNELTGMKPDLDLADFKSAWSMTGGGVNELLNVPTMAGAQFLVAQHQLTHLLAPVHTTTAWI